MKSDSVSALQDRAGFESMLRHHEKSIYNIVYQIVRNSEDAEDVTQTVFFRAYEKRGRFNPRYPLFCWLYRIAVNESLNLVKRETRRRELPTQGTTKDPSQELRLVRGEMRRCIHSALGQLSADHRAVIVLKHFQDCSYNEISKILEIPIERVRSRLFEARKRIQRALEGDRCFQK